MRASEHAAANSLDDSEQNPFAASDPELLKSDDTGRVQNPKFGPVSDLEAEITENAHERKRNLSDYENRGHWQGGALDLLDRRSQIFLQLIQK